MGGFRASHKPEQKCTNLGTPRGHLENHKLLNLDLLHGLAAWGANSLLVSNARCIFTAGSNAC
eukprot:350491-Amphidinium_carterae.1